MAIPLRHELKYYIGTAQYMTLRASLLRLLHQDPNAARNGGQYAIRSLYFDTVFDTAYYDKINGVKDRDKYRIRIYNYSDRDIFMECKTKVGAFISKRSLKIPRSLADQLTAGDPMGLEFTTSGLLRDVYREMRLNLLRPAVIVDYDREAYIHPVEDVRITFDKNVRTGFNSTEIFDDTVPTLPVLEPGEMILEVKYNRVLPPYLADVISYCCPEAVQCAISKYTLCRRFEGKEQ